MAGSAITRSMFIARRFRDKLTSLTATVRLSTEQPYWRHRPSPPAEATIGRGRDAQLLADHRVG